MEELQQIEDYLHRGIYPEGLSKGEKANFRRKCKNNYKFEDGVLYYTKCIGRVPTVSSEETNWRICVRSNDEKQRILQSCHSGTAGGHFGRDKTTEKICSRFYWKNMFEEIRAYVLTCVQCQKMNARFVKSNAQLHPIAVQQKVWCQVYKAQII